MLHVDIIYLVCRGKKYAAIQTTLSSISIGLHFISNVLIYVVDYNQSISSDKIGQKLRSRVQACVAW